MGFENNLKLLLFGFFYGVLLNGVGCIKCYHCSECLSLSTNDEVQDCDTYMNQITECITGFLYISVGGKSDVGVVRTCTLPNHCEKVAETTRMMYPDSEIRCKGLTCTTDLCNSNTYSKEDAIRLSGATEPTVTSETLVIITCILYSLSNNCGQLSNYILL